MIAVIICLLVIIIILIWQAIQLFDVREQLLQEIQRLRGDDTP